ncbi:MAG: hypothetical protein WC491_03440 [Candidatus Omnitrophota bacterium]
MAKNTIYSVIFGLSLIFLLNTIPASASQVFKAACTKPDCGFTTELCMGPSNTSDYIIGYCTGCGKVVYLEYLREGHLPVPRLKGREKPPKPVAQSWDPGTGKAVSLYKCPSCKKPFKSVDSANDFKYCPKCGSQVKVESTGKFID